MENLLNKKIDLEIIKISCKKGFDFDGKNAQAFKNRFPLYGSLL